MEKILVPIDGSKGSHLALEKAREIGSLKNADILILNVIKNLGNTLYSLETEDMYEINRVYSEQAEKVLTEALELFEGYEGKIDTKLIQGDPAHEIIKIAEEEKFDLVIMGSRGLNALSRVMIGSVSNKVVNNVDTSVLIVK